MSIAERAAKYGVSRKLIRKMIRGGDLKSEPKGDLAAFIRARLSLHQQLSVEHLIALIKNRKLFRELGAHMETAREQVSELGDVDGGAAPSHVTESLRGAAEGDAESIEILMLWLKSVLPKGPVRHHWVASRLLTRCSPNLRRSDYTCAWKALENVRAQTDFEEWWDKKPMGTQNPVFYQRPALPFDL